LRLLTPDATTRIPAKKLSESSYPSSLFEAQRTNSGTFARFWANRQRARDLRCLERIGTRIKNLTDRFSGTRSTCSEFQGFVIARVASTPD
jgi:hypothetical protein